jgi:hypothetical protein
MQATEERPTEPRVRDGRTRRRRAVVGVAATLAILAVVALVWARDDGSGDRPGDNGASAPTTPTSEAPDTTADRPAPVRESSPPAAATAPSGETDSTIGATNGSSGAQVLADGRHPVYFTGFDVAGSTVEFDMVQYLTGAEARAYAEAHEDEFGDDYYDNYVVNDNPRLRTLPVAGDVGITVLQTAQGTGNPHAISFGELPGYVGPDQGYSTPHLGSAVFWLTVRDGTVVTIDEQYAP